MRKILVSAAACGLAVMASATPAKPVQTGTPEQIKALLACRAVTDPAGRLACFDRQTAGIDQALTAKNLVVVDRAQANAARRSLFGFSVPNFAGLLGGGSDDMSQIESTVANAHRNSDGGWTVALADGSVWSQSDDAPLALAPRRGDKIVVKRRALGRYAMEVGRQNGVTVRRIN